MSAECCVRRARDQPKASGWPASRIDLAAHPITKVIVLIAGVWLILVAPGRISPSKQRMVVVM